MAHPEKFEFDRSRGVVWVCDLAGSSTYLNDNHAVEAVEQFLPRLHWTASLIVHAAGGKWVKWTGDGFLAWFETPLHRDLGEQSRAVFEAAWHLTVLVNVTQLGLDPKRKFRIRHGVAYEQDALLTKMTYPGGFESLDLTGRAVVLAFRLSGVTADFPCIVTQRELVEASTAHRPAGLEFKRWQPSVDERLKFLKGERWGTSSLYKSGGRRPRARSPRMVVKLAKQYVNKAEGEIPGVDASVAFARRFLDSMLSGPDWCRGVVDEYMRFLREDLLGNIKRLLPILEETAHLKSRGYEAP